MGEIKISELEPTTSVIGSDLIAGVESSITKKIKAEHILMTKSLIKTKWDDIRVAVISIKTGGSKDPDFIKVIDDGSGSQGVFTYAFDKTTEEELYFVREIPHNWKIGTDLKAHVHWAPTNTDTGTIQWGLEYTLVEENGIIGNSIIALSIATAAPGTLLQHKLLDIDDIDMSAVTTISAIMLCRIFRNVVVDTYNADALLFQVDFHYEIDSLGSDEEDTK